MPNKMMTMPGISPWLFLMATTGLVALTLVVTWLLEFRRDDRYTHSSDYRRLDLLGNVAVQTVIKARPFQFFLRLPFVLIFLFIIFAGLFGTQTSGKNIAPLLTWTIWWAALILFILFLGKIWCLG